MSNVPITFYFIQFSYMHYTLSIPNSFILCCSSVKVIIIYNNIIFLRVYCKTYSFGFSKKHLRPILYMIALCNPLIHLARHFAPLSLILTVNVKILKGSLGFYKKIIYNQILFNFFNPLNVIF